MHSTAFFQVCNGWTRCVEAKVLVDIVDGVKHVEVHDVSLWHVALHAVRTEGDQDQRTHTFGN